MCKVRSIATREEQSTPPRLKQAPAMKTQEGENLLEMRMRMKMMVRTGATLEMRVRGQKEGMTVVVRS